MPGYSLLLMTEVQESMLNIQGLLRPWLDVLFVDCEKVAHKLQLPCRFTKVIATTQVAFRFKND